MADSVLVDLAVNLGCLVVGYVANWVRRKYLARRDHSKIYDWLVTESRKPKAKKFRTTQAIASHLNLSQERVRDICSGSELITEVIGNAGLWGISLRR